MQKKGTVLRGIVLVLVLCCLALTIGARLGLFSGAVLTITANGEVTELDVQRGQVADVSQFEAAPAGYRFICWLDADGNEADLTQPVEGDASYTALFVGANKGCKLLWSLLQAFSASSRNRSIQRNCWKPNIQHCSVVGDRCQTAGRCRSH